MQLGDSSIDPDAALDIASETALQLGWVKRGAASATGYVAWCRKRLKRVGTKKWIMRLDNQV